jgi:signal transduction histidine kinase/ActR/RegA family two-component response regulator
MQGLDRLSAALSRSYVARFVVATGVYGAVLWLSFFLIPPTGTTSLVWPPAALGLAILFFWGYDLWPAIATAFFAVLLLRGGVAPPLIVSTAIGNVVESLVAAYVLHQYVRFSPMMNRLRDMLGFIAAAIIATIGSASIISAGVLIFNQQTSLNTNLWISLWIGHLVSLLSFGPFAIRWLYRPLFRKTSREVVEGVGLFGIIFTLSFLAFWTPYTAVGGISLVYILILPLLWSALRTGPRGISLALLIVALVGSTGVLFGYGPIAQAANLSQSLFGIQVLIGILSLIFLLFTSITEERKEAVINLESHVEKLETALAKISSEDQAKADFIAILAHELRNPLSPILSGLELLKTDEQGPTEVHMMMGAHLNTIARLLDDLLDISRISQKKFKLQKEPVEIHKVISHTIEMVRPQLETRQHKLTVVLPEMEVWLNGDPVRLAQIFVNLLNNAAKYTDPGGSISLEGYTGSGELVVKIKDNGIGIARERLHNVFEPFGGLEKDGHRPGGLRIGLSLAKRMVEMHHGTLTAHSSGVGQGAEFTVRLPLPPTMPIPLGEETQKPRRSRFSKESLTETKQKLGRLKVLVVDDNEPAAIGLGKLLEQHGHEVLLAYDAPQAIDIAHANRPQVAILDIGLPTMDGYELAAKMRERWGKEMTLVALTGYGQTEDKQKSKDAGFDEHLVKPVSITDVQKVLIDLRTKH